MPTSINKTISCNEPHANLDVYYGPYNSIIDALNALADVTIAEVIYHKRHVGLTVGIWNSTKTQVTEYWFNGGIGDSNLIEKTSGGGGGGDLPANVSVIMFDKNGGSGAQNSILTDAYNNIALPEPTITFSDHTFSGWDYESATYYPGDVITIGESKIIKALWSGYVQKYTVSWTNGTNVTISGEDNLGNEIDNGDQVVAGKVITLTAVYPQGYTFNGWSNKPTGATESGNTLTFTLNDDVSGVSASASEPAPTQYTVSWTDGTNVTITGTANGITIDSGQLVNENSSIILTATYPQGYTFNGWTNIPTGATESGNTLTFTLTDNVSGVSASASEPAPTQYTVSWTDGTHVTITGTANGTSIDSGQLVNENSSIVLTANYPQDYTFDGWTNIPTGATESGNTLTFTLTDNVSGVSASAALKYRVSWEDGDNVTITGTANGTSIENGQPVNENSSIVLTANYPQDYTFDGWTNIPQGAIESANTLTFTLTDNVSGVSASASEPAPTQYRVSWTNGTNVTISGEDNLGNEINNGDQVVAGTTVILTASYPQGYTFNGWTNIPTGAIESGNTLTFTLTDNVSDVSASAALKYRVSWKQILSSNVTITGEDNLGNEINNGDQVVAGTTVTLTATYPQDYTFNGWTEVPANCSVNGNILTFILNSNVSNIDASASYTPLIAQGHSLSWDTTENVNIIATANGREVNNGANVTDNSTITLTPTYDTSLYSLAWTNKPTGATESGNILTFTLNNGDVSGIKANLTRKQYTVSWIEGNNIDNIEATANGTTISKGASVDAGSTIELYPWYGKNYTFNGWSNTPEGASTTGPLNDILTFTLTGNVSSVTCSASPNMLNN